MYPQWPWEYCNRDKDSILPHPNNHRNQYNYRSPRTVRPIRPWGTNSWQHQCRELQSLYCPHYEIFNCLVQPIFSRHRHPCWSRVTICWDCGCPQNHNRLGWSFSLPIGGDSSSQWSQCLPPLRWEQLTSRSRLISNLQCRLTFKRLVRINSLFYFNVINGIEVLDLLQPLSLWIHN